MSGSTLPRSIPRIAVVGASGFVGRSVSEWLERRGAEVTRVSAPRLVANSTDSQVEVLRHADVIDSLAVRLRDHDAVVNAAGLPEAGSSDHMGIFAANAVLPGVIARASSTAGVQRFVHVSSAAVQGRARVLDESPAVSPFSPYSRSKAEGERTAREFGPPEVVVYRPPGVHGRERVATRTLSRLARSRLSSVAGPGQHNTPQALVDNVGDAVAFLALDSDCPQVALHPSEGHTTESLLRALGAARVRHVPIALARALVSIGSAVGRVSPAAAAQVRRLEMLWFGQEQAATALTSAGWQPPVGIQGWRELAQATAPRPRLLYVLTVASQAATFLRGQLTYMKEAGWDVTIACSPGPGLAELATREGVEVVALPTARDISPLRDLASLWALVRLMRRLRPTAVNGSTPKAAMLAMVASRITGVQRRVYLVRGLRAESAAGRQRTLLEAIERLTSWCATDVLAVSDSLANELVRRRLTGRHRPRILGNGSSNGVDAESLANRARSLNRFELRRQHGIDENDFVIGFVGRLCRDKGVAELADALADPRLAGCVVVTQGAVEDASLLERLEGSGCRHVHLEWHEDVTPALVMSDVLTLPTHREGFPNVVLEASAVERPVVATDATGSVDSVRHGETGFVVARGDSHALATALVILRQEPTMRQRMGAAGHTWVSENFRPEDVWVGLDETYRGKASVDARARPPLSAAAPEH